jgi:hypothetical protein
MHANERVGGSAPAAYKPKPAVEPAVSPIFARWAADRVIPLGRFKAFRLPPALRQRVRRSDARALTFRLKGGGHA